MNHEFKKKKNGKQRGRKGNKVKISETGKSKANGKGGTRSEITGTEEGGKGTANTG